MGNRLGVFALLKILILGATLTTASFCLSENARANVLPPCGGSSNMNCAGPPTNPGYPIFGASCDYFGGVSASIGINGTCYESGSPCYCMISGATTCEEKCLNEQAYATDKLATTPDLTNISCGTGGLCNCGSAPFHTASCVGGSTGPITFSFTPNGNTFGGVPVGGSLAAPSTKIKNTSPYDGTPCYVYMVGPEASQFSVSAPPACDNLVSGASCIVTVTASPNKTNGGMPMKAQIEVDCGNVASNLPTKFERMFADILNQGKKTLIKSAKSAGDILFPQAHACPACKGYITGTTAYCCPAGYVYNGGPATCLSAMSDPGGCLPDPSETCLGNLVSEKCSSTGGGGGGGGGSSGTGVSADFSVIGVGVPTSPFVNVGIPPETSLDIGSQMEGVVDTTQTWTQTIKNLGTGDATGCSAPVSDHPAFIISTHNCGATIVAGGSCTATMVPLAAPVPVTSYFNVGGRPNVAHITIACANYPVPFILNSFRYSGHTKPVISLFPAGTITLPPTPRGQNSTSAGIGFINLGGWDASSCAFDVPNTGADPSVFTVSLGTCGTIPSAGGTGTCSASVIGNSAIAGTFTATATLRCSSPATGGPYIVTPINFSINVLATPCTGGKFDNGLICQCPDGYEDTPVTAGSGTNACRPVLMSQEFYKTNNAFSDGFPVCGAGRVPVTSILNTIDIATTGVPNTTRVYPYSTPNPPVYYNYQYTMGSGVGTSSAAVSPTPHYVYADPTVNLTRCACGTNNGSLSALSPTFLTPAITNAAGTPVPRFPSDYYGTIAGVTASPTSTPYYGEVQIANDNTSNGYLGTIYSAGNSVCGCPNLNEVVSAQTDAANPSRASGYSCASNLNEAGDVSGVTTAFKMLTKYDTAAHATQLLAGNTLTAVTTIQLPLETGGYQKYDRRIWTCKPPTVLNTAAASRMCEAPWTLAALRTKNACDHGPTAGGGPISPMSPRIPSTVANFDGIVNKKLACCMNAFDQSNPSAALKYDCAENSKVAYADFDTLWTSVDNANDGGQPNAVALTNSSGQPITGFYRLDGTRCSQYSEFGATTYKYATLNQAIVSGQQASVAGVVDGATITPPNPAANPLRATVVGLGRGVPHDGTATEAQKMRECPILVRAAMVATCPTPPTYNTAGSSTTVQQSYADSAAANALVHCLAADKVKIHMRIEQIYTILGLPAMKTLDSVLDARQASDVSVSDLIANKTAGICPGGSKLQPDGTCAY